MHIIEKNSLDFKQITFFDLSQKVPPYSGPLRKVIVGDPAGDHVTIDLKDLYANINRGDREYYWIDLERIQTSSQMLDWIMQIASKTWATPQIIGLLTI